MYDTVNMWLPFNSLGNFDMSQSIKSLSRITEYVHEDGQVGLSGYLQNYRVNVSENGLSLKGSLAKYYLSNNFNTLTRSDSKSAIEKMSDELSLPIKIAKVNRIDFAHNFQMDYAPEAYYNFLGESQYYNRQPQSNSLYYSNHSRQKLFYNKTAEAKANGVTPPCSWLGKNILRYEMRFKTRLSKQFNQAEVKANSLTEEKFYQTVYGKWLEEYKAIDKLNSIKFNLSNMNSPKDFKKQLELFAIKKIGQDKLIQEIESMRYRKAFAKPEYYSRLKKDLKELCKTPKMTEKSYLIAELDKKVKSSTGLYW